ncbi:MAG TPA: SRPBCC domain-containing protein [Bryobacteraceae bacterium]|nr:SRPBCC domain-containing protein [Bryobacteraceae bacterium]
MTTASMHPENTVVIRRRIPARREEVFAAWTDPESIRHWMCPGDVQTATAELDVRVGGKFRLVMKSPQRDYVHSGEYLAVEPPAKLAFTWSLGENEPPLTRVTVELADAGESCELTLTHQRFADSETARRYSGGWDQIGQKLAEYFEQRSGRSEDLRMQLEFAAPVAKLYQQFATQQGVQNWWTLFCEMQERVGGQASFRFPSSGFHAVVKILRLDPPNCVEWEVTDSKHPESSGFVDLNDWIGTRIRFDLAEIPGGRSHLRFTHYGLKLKECLGVCTSAWSFFLNDSLRGYLETGVGKAHAKA